MWKLVRYRPGQALTVALLSAVVAACAGFATLYDRATQQALVDVELSRAPVQQSGLRLASADPTSLSSSLDALTKLLPAGVQPLFIDPVAGARGTASVVPEPGERAPVGLLTWRDQFCEHVHLLEGRCPTAGGDVAVSETDAAVFGYEPGDEVRVGGQPPTAGSVAPVGALRIVGVYQQEASDYWFGDSLTGLSGLLDQSSAQHIQHDAWLTPQETFESRDLPRLPNAAATVDLALDRPRVGVDELAAVAPVLRRLQSQATDSGLTVSTGLPAIADDVGAQREQSRVTVPLLMVQLGLLVVVVFWLVLDTLTEQRRRELAVALLHGAGQQGARSRLVGEVVPPVVAGAVLGSAAALAACAASARWLLPGAATVELRTPFVLTTLGALVVLVVIVALGAWRVSRQPVQSLLRTVGTRRAGWGLGSLETLVLVAAGTLVLGFVFGWLTGPAALAGPMLLALVVGLLLGHAIGPVATGSGGRLLRRGRLAAGVGVLGAARSPAARRTVAIVTVATALLVFSADAFVVSDRNRQAAAAQEVGARLVANLDSTDLGAIHGALAKVDPDGRAVTPVVRVRALNDDATETLAVVPNAFASIALFPANGPQLAAERMSPPDVAPIHVTGTGVTGLVGTSSLSATGSRPAAVSLVLVIDGAPAFPVRLSSLRSGSDQRRFSADLPCRSGCTLTGIQFDTTPGSTLSGDVTLSDVRTGGSDADARGPGHAVTFGADADWYGPPATQQPDTGGDDSGSTGSAGSVTSADDELTVALSSSGGSQIVVKHAWVPQLLPAVVAGTLANGETSAPGGTGTTIGRGELTIGGLDGVERPAVLIATLPSVPGAAPNAALVDLDYAERGLVPGAEDSVSLWFAADDKALLAKVTDALAGAGVNVTGTHTLADTQLIQNQSLAAWSMQLAVVVGVACLVLAALVLLVIAAATWRVRSRDLASLRMSGVQLRAVRRIAALETVLAVTLAVIAGVACGTVGAQVSLPTIPILATTPEAYTIDLTPAWVSVATSTAAAFAFLTAVAWGTGEAVARRATLSRIRDNT